MKTAQVYGYPWALAIPLDGAMHVHIRNIVSPWRSRFLVNGNVFIGFGRHQVEQAILCS